MSEVTGGPVQTGGEEQIVREVSAPLFAAKGWMKFLGVLMIISGALYALTIVGIIFCWLPIWIGVVLFQSATATESAQTSGSKMELYGAMAKLKTYFTINGVMALIMIVLTIVFMVVMLVGGLASMAPFMHGYNY